MLFSRFATFLDYFRHQNLGPDDPTGGFNYRNAFLPQHWFVNPQLGSDTNDGRDPRLPKATIATLIGNGSSSLAHSGDVIHVVGNITEEVTGYNLLEDITIIGESNRPRHADRARDYATYAYATLSENEISGCSWRSPSTPAGPLLTIRAQGWRVENILFACPTDYAGVYIESNALSDVSEYSGGHAVFKGCRFDAGKYGIQDQTGNYNVLVDDCIFRGQTTASIFGGATPVAVPLMWEIRNSHFSNNDAHILISASRWNIHHNAFGAFTTFGINLQYVSAQGSNNMVWMNTLYGDYSTAAYLAGTSDEWSGNISGDEAETEVSGGWTTDSPQA